MIAQRVEPTLSLMLITLILSVVVAVPIGVLAAWKVGTLDRPRHHGLCGVRLLGSGVVVGYLLAFIFALQFEWLPVQGYTPIAQGVLAWLQN